MHSSLQSGAVEIRLGAARRDEDAVTLVSRIDHERDGALDVLDELHTLGIRGQRLERHHLLLGFDWLPLLQDRALHDDRLEVVLFDGHLDDDVVPHSVAHAGARRSPSGGSTRQTSDDAEHHRPVGCLALEPTLELLEAAGDVLFEELLGVSGTSVMSGHSPRGFRRVNRSWIARSALRGYPSPTMTSSDAPSAGTPKKRSTPLRAFFGRFFLGHMLAYPVGFAAAVAALPLAMMVHKEELMSPGRFGARSQMLADVARDLHMTPLEAAQMEIVLRFTLWICVAALVLVHVAVLPWSVAAARAVGNPPAKAAVQKTYRLFAAVTGGTLVLLGVGGTGLWIWVLTR